jgi:hypothetical protein
VCLHGQNFAVFLVEAYRRRPNEGYPITISHRQTFGYQQAVLTNDAVRKVASLDYDWIMPLDADEFIGPDLKHALNALSEDVPGKLMLRNFIPLAGDYFEASAPLWSCFRARETELSPNGKVVLSRALARRSVLQMGNHEAYHRSGRQLPAQTLDTRLDHAPVRSAEQLVSKVLIGVHNASLKRRRADQLCHWELMADEVRRHRYKLDAAALQELAFHYSAPGATDRSLSRDPAGVGTPTDVMRYPALARIEPLERFDGFAAALCSAMRGPSHPAGDWLRQMLGELSFRSRRKLGWL